MNWFSLKLMYSHLTFEMNKWDVLLIILNQTFLTDCKLSSTPLNKDVNRSEEVSCSILSEQDDEESALLTSVDILLTQHSLFKIFKLIKYNQLLAYFNKIIQK